MEHRQSRLRYRSLIVALLLSIAMVGAAPASAHYVGSGDHAGCASTSSGHFVNNDIWFTTYDLEYPGGDDTTWNGIGNKSIQISGYWGGGWWVIHGDANDDGSGWMHCH